MQPNDSSGGPPVNQGLYRLLATPDLSVDLRLINTINEENLTEEEKLAKVIELIGSKININLEDKDGKTALHHSASKGYAKIIKTLVEALDAEVINNVSADSNLNELYGRLTKSRAEAINNVSTNQNTPLAEACFNNHLLAAEALIEEGANLKYLIKGRSLLFIFSESGNNEIVEILIRAKADLNQANKDGETPIYAACKYNHHDVVQQLIRAKADLNQANKDGESPIFVACKHGHHDVVQQLIKAKADLNQANKDGESPIFVACKHGHHDVVQQLIVAGANVNQAKKDGTTPLLVACRGGHIDVINTLFYAGADVECLKEQGFFGPVIKYELQLIFKANKDLEGLINKITKIQNIKYRDDKLTNVTSSLVFEVTTQATQNNIALAPKPSSDVASAGAGLVAPIEISSTPTPQRSL